MTLDEAIKHAEDVADTCEYEASKYDMSDSYERHVACKEGECVAEHRQLAEWLKELKWLREQPRWIPCSERLPKDGENVIVSIHDDSGDYACDYASFGWYAVKGKFWVVDNEVNERVVAWLPLPIPYRKGGQE